MMHFSPSTVISTNLFIILNFLFDTTKLSKSPNKSVMPPIGLVWGNKTIHNQMKAISILCAVSYAILLITMCDMGVWFWIASTAFAVTSLVISNELDNIENQKK